MIETVIHFSNFYDVDRNFIEPGKVNLGHLYLGPQGLLEFLERKSGIFIPHLSSFERCYNIKEIIDSDEEYVSNSFFSESYKKDPISVAEYIIEMIEGLHLNGVFVNNEKYSERINTLLSISDRSKISFIGKRWKRVIEKYSTNKLSDAIVLNYYEPIELYRPLVKEAVNSAGFKVVDKCYIIDETKKGNNIDELKRRLLNFFNSGKLPQDKISGFNKLENDNSVVFLNSPGDSSTGIFISSILHSDDVLINSEDYLTDYFLRFFGKPGIKVKEDSSVSSMEFIPQIIAILMQGNPDPELILDFLKISPNPLGKELTNGLKKAIKSQSGTGNVEWNTLVEEYLSTFEETDNSENKIDVNLIKGLLKVLDTKREFTEELSVKELGGILRKLKKWSETKRKKTPLLKRNVEKLNSIIDEILFSFKSDETIHILEILQIVDSAYSNSTKILREAEINSSYCINNSGSLNRSIEKAIWSKFNGDSYSGPEMDYLFKSELEVVKNDFFYDTDSKRKMDIYGWMKAVFYSNQIIFIEQDIINAEESDFHSFKIILDLVCNTTDLKVEISKEGISELYSVDFEEKKVSSLPEKKAAYWNLGEKISLREEESYSSLKRLIEYPAEWYLKYKLQIKDERKELLQSEPILMGNVSELIIYECLETLNGEYNDNLVVDIIEKYIFNSLAFLNQKNNSSRRLHFKDSVKGSLQQLYFVMQIHGLKVMFNNSNNLKNKYQHNVKGNIRGVELKGEIDLLLSDSNGKPWIIDIKWTGNKNQYLNHVIDNSDYQLLIYSYLLSGRSEFSHLDWKTMVTGYLDLGSKRIISRSSEDIIEGIYTVINYELSSILKAEALNKFFNSVDFRISELNKGLIEVGNSVNVDNLDYFNIMKDQDLIELKKNSNSLKVSSNKNDLKFFYD